MVNRLKLLKKDLITLNQTSFIPGRHIIDNIVTCQELVHSLKYTGVMNGGMIMKLDLEKAYDRLEWSFVEETLCDVALLSGLIHVIMSILRSSSCRLMWNRNVWRKLCRHGSLDKETLCHCIYLCYVWTC